MFLLQTSERKKTVFRDTMCILLLTGPIKKPPILQTDCHQTGTTNHPLHAPSSQRCSLIQTYRCYHLILFKLFFLFCFVCCLFSRYDLYSRGQQNLHWQYGEFWENGKSVSSWERDDLFVMMHIPSCKVDGITEESHLRFPSADYR